MLLQTYEGKTITGWALKCKELELEVERLELEVDTLTQQETHWSESNERLKAILQKLDWKGGLGMDVHAEIQAALKETP